MATKRQLPEREQRNIKHLEEALLSCQKHTIELQKRIGEYQEMVIELLGIKKPEAEDQPEQ